MLVTIKNVKKEVSGKSIDVDVHFLTLKTGEYSDTVYIFETNLETMVSKKIMNFRRELEDYSDVHSFGRRFAKISNGFLRLMIVQYLDEVLICTDEDLTKREDCLVVPTVMHKYTLDIDKDKSVLYRNHMEECHEWGFARAFTQSLDYKVNILDLPDEVQDQINSAIYTDNKTVSIYHILESLETLEHSSHDVFRY